MYSFPLLGALQVETSRFLNSYQDLPNESIFTSCGDGNLYVKSTDYKTTTQVDIDQYKNWKEIPLGNGNLQDRVNCANDLLSLRKAKNFEEALGFLIVEEALEDSIKSAVLNGGHIFWLMNEKTEFRSKDSVSSYDTLVAASYIKKGYRIKEVIGRHFLVKSTSGLEHLTTERGCTCQSYVSLGDCGHVRLIRCFMGNPKPFLKYKLIEY